MNTNFQEQVNGLLVEQQGNLLVYTFDDITRDTLDVWTDHFTDYLVSLSGEPFQVLMDVSQDTLSFTPYFRSSTQSVIDAYGHLPGRIAVLSHNRLITSVVDLYMRLQKQKRFQVAFFADRKAALKWLAEIN